MQMRSIITFFITLLCVANCFANTKDTTLNRVVTVERNYRPDIIQVSKIQLTPYIQTEDTKSRSVIYSSYSNPLVVDYNLHPLKAAKTDFTPQSTLKGLVEGAVGHRNSHMAFGYRITEVEGMSLNLFANHDAYWGRDALSQSQLGMELVRHFKKMNIFFGVDGNNEYFTYYGRQYDGNKGLLVPIGTPIDHQNLWKINAKIGMRTTNPKKPIQFGIQTGYKAFIAADYAVENQVRTYFDLTWKARKKHGAGVNLYLQNSFYTKLFEDSVRHNKHALRLEPFYEYKHGSICLHAGVNVDMNIGTGKLLSTVDNISFAPSPNIEFEWNMMDNIFHFYTTAKGSMGIGSLEEYLEYNRYLNIVEGVKFNTPRSYNPIDMQIGFKIRPINTMLIDVYGGYAYTINGCNMMAIVDTVTPSVIDYSLTQSNYQLWKVGASLHYHYRDFVNVNVKGNYYAWKNMATTEVYDRPTWDLYARVDFNIDSKWSVYSENYFAGKTFAHTNKGIEQLKNTISLNVGGQYAVNNWLLVYLQLNNYLNRKNDIFYGYQSQGCHFLGGVKYKF